MRAVRRQEVVEIIGEVRRRQSAAAQFAPDRFGGARDLRHL
jgi:hypothetical protein